MVAVSLYGGLLVVSSGAVVSARKTQRSVLLSNGMTALSTHHVATIIPTNQVIALNIISLRAPDSWSPIRTTMWMPARMNRPMLC